MVYSLKTKHMRSMNRGRIEYNKLYKVYRKRERKVRKLVEVVWPIHRDSLVELAHKAYSGAGIDAERINTVHQLRALFEIVVLHCMLVNERHALHRVAKQHFDNEVIEDLQWVALMEQTEYEQAESILRGIGYDLWMLENELEAISI